MLVLVINSGSSSLKYQVCDAEAGSGWTAPPSGTAPQASPAAKKQRGEKGSWPVT